MAFFLLFPLPKKLHFSPYIQAKKSSICITANHRSTASKAGGKLYPCAVVAKCKAFCYGVLEKCKLTKFLFLFFQEQKALLGSVASEKACNIKVLCHFLSRKVSRVSVAKSRQGAGRAAIYLRQQYPAKKN